MGGAFIITLDGQSRGPRMLSPPTVYGPKQQSRSIAWLLPFSSFLITAHAPPPPPTWQLIHSHLLLYSLLLCHNSLVVFLYLYLSLSSLAWHPIWSRVCLKASLGELVAIYINQPPKYILFFCSLLGVMGLTSLQVCMDSTDWLQVSSAFRYN